MIALLNFATLVMATMFATAAAAVFHWLLLRASFLMMPPAARRIGKPMELPGGTPALARAVLKPHSKVPVSEWTGPSIHSA